MKTLYKGNLFDVSRTTTIIHNMKNELLQLDWFFTDKTKSFNKVIDNIIEECETLRRLFSK